MIDRQAFPSGADAESDTDAALLAAVGFSRNALAFEELYRRHIDCVTRAALRICPDERVAEDIAQRTFATFWERAGRLASKAVQLRPWLLTVARNAAIDHQRAESPYVPMTGDEAEGRGSSACPQETAVMNELIADLAPALAALSSSQRTVIELRYFGGLSFQAIAEQTGETVAAVKASAQLGIARLRSAIG